MRALVPPFLFAATLCLVSGCAPSAPPKVSSPPPSEPAAPSATAAAKEAAPIAEKAPAPEPCGALECQLFDTPEDAFRAVLASHPQVLAIGETHAQKGSEGEASTTKRFTTALLPLLEGLASDLVLELWVADGACGEKEKEVAAKQAPVTSQQAETDQNEFVTLGNRAVSLGIKPHVLRPNCEQYQHIASAGDDAVVEMLTMITRMTASGVKNLLARNEGQASKKMVVAYGGAMHNDLKPFEERAIWSFGPELYEATKERYVELDLIAPHLIRKTAAWEGLAWYPHFDPAAHPEKTTLYRPNPGSFVLIFPSAP